MSLTLAAAEQVETLALDYSPGTAIGLATAFARVFIAIAILAASVAATYLAGRRLLHSPLRQRTA
jgi:hypothetical protein